MRKHKGVLHSPVANSKSIAIPRKSILVMKDKLLLCGYTQRSNTFKDKEKEVNVGKGSLESSASWRNAILDAETGFFVLFEAKSTKL